MKKESNTGAARDTEFRKPRFEPSGSSGEVAIAKLSSLSRLVLCDQCGLIRPVGERRRPQTAFRYVEPSPGKKACPRFAAGYVDKFCSGRIKDNMHVTQRFAPVALGLLNCNLQKFVIIGEIH